MRTILKTLFSVGCIAAALFLAGPVHGQGMSGGTGSFSGGGGGGGGGGGSSSSSSSASDTNFQITGQQLQTSVSPTPSILNSFNNVGTGTGTNGYVSSSNPLAAYYYNPLAQGLITISSSGNSTPSNSQFGAALYGTSTGGTGSGSGSSAINRASGSSSSTGGSSSLNGTATLRGGTGTTGTTGTAILFTGGGSYGPANGRRGPVIPYSLHGPLIRSIPMTTRRPDLQQIIASSTAISAPGGIIVSTDGNAVVLTGTVATEAERTIAANVLRLSPGVKAIQNNLTVGPPVGPGTSPGPQTTPGPGPIAPPPG